MDRVPLVYASIANAVAPLRKLSRWSLLVIAINCSVVAAPLSQDLGQGLRYLRLTNLTADSYLAKSDPGTHTIVLDLRGNSVDPTSGSAFSEWLDSRIKPESPVIILLNEDSDPNLLRILNSSTWPALVTLAHQGVPFPADVVIDTGSEADRKACDAIDRGEPLETLISAKVAKERLDEAKLAKSYEINGRSVPRDIEDSKKKSPASASDGSTKIADLVLARAVQIHRAMLALRLAR